MHTLVFLSTRQVLQCQPEACQALPPAVQGGLHGQGDRGAARAGAHVALPPAQLPAAAAGVRPLQLGPAAGAAQHRECAGGDPGAHSPAPHPGGRGWHTVLLQEARTAVAGHDGPPGRRCGAGPRHHEHVGLHGSHGPHVRGTAAGWDRGARADPCSCGGVRGPSGEPASYAFLREALRSSAGSPLRLCCRDLRAEDLPMRNTVALLQLLDAGCLCCVDLRFNNLGLRGLSVIIPHVAHFQCLASLRLHYVHGDSRQPSVDGRLDQLLSTLQSPLESLELAFCALLPEDLRFLARSPHAVHLKKLDLCGNDLSGSQLEPFQGLLQAAAATLLHLELTECQLADTQLLATLPVLTCCASLRYLGLYGNPLSMAGLKELLRDSVAQAELHTFPVDCYEGLPWPPPSSVLLEAAINEEEFACVEAELHQLLLASGRAHVVWTTDIYGRLAADYFSL